MNNVSPQMQSQLDALDPHQKDALEFIRILARDGVVAFLDGSPPDRRVAFRLQKVGIAVLVRSPEGEPLGAFANPVAAALHGYDYLEGKIRDRHSVDLPPK